MGDKLVLEVGKYYTVRDPEEAGVIKVRVDAIREDISDPLYAVSTTTFYVDGRIVSDTCALDGRWSYDIISEPRDLVAEYEEPTIPYSPDLVGRRIRMAHGVTYRVDRYTRSRVHEELQVSNIFVPESGDAPCTIVRILDSRDPSAVIVEVLDNE